jgi:hypothetical protein
MIETMLRPRRSRVAAPAVLMSALLGVLIFSTWRLSGDSAFNAADVWEVLGIIAICAMLIGAMSLENKRLRSVKLTSESVSGLMWRRNAFPHLIHLEGISIPWNSAPKVAVDGLSILIEKNGDRITVNTQLFDNPAEVLDLIRQCAKQVK